MKTTIELPDALATRARQVARERRVTLRELVTDGLRAELERLADPRPRVDFHFHSRGGAGLQHGMDSDSLTAWAYDLPR